MLKILLVHVVEEFPMKVEHRKRHKAKGRYDEDRLNYVLLDSEGLGDKLHHSEVNELQHYR
jgi:hypothetical protein